MENTVIKGYFHRGKEEGRQEGEHDGARREAMNILTRQLERRFGPLPEAASQKLKAAELATLEDWSLRLLDATSLEQALASA
jgi:hypothetical protein